MESREAEQSPMRAQGEAVRPWLWIVVLAGVVLVFAVDGLDHFGVSTRLIGGTVAGEKDTWTVKLKHRCMVTVSTAEGDLQTRYIGDCRGKWQRGEAVTLEVVDGRLSGTAVVGGSMKHSAAPVAAP